MSPYPRLFLSLTPWASFACSPIPKEIPREPGLVSDAADMARLWLPASPDNVSQLYFMMKAFEARTDESCPERVENASGYTLTAQGCTDEFGTRWDGEANLFEEESDRVEFADFEMDAGDYGWLIDGSMSWDHPDSSDLEIDVTVSIDLRDEHDSYLAWMNLSTRLEFAGGAYALRNLNGEVGIEDWGLADVTSDGVTLGLPIGCDYPANGSVKVEGENSMTWDFGEADEFACAVCPTWTLDGQEMGEFCEPLHIIDAAVLSPDEEAEAAS